MSLPPYDRSVRDFERHYQVVLPDSVGQAAIGFRDGAWFRLNSGTPHSVPIRSAIIICPHAAGSIVQIVCWWMRENTRSPRALDLATELALAVGELARKAIEDDPLGMSITTLPDPAPSPMAASSFGSGAYPANPYPAAAPYPAAYPAAAAPYQANGAYPSYAGAAPMAAATTILPQITPDMANPAFGGQSSVNAVPRPAGPLPSMPALPSGPAPRGPQNGAGGQYPGNPYPSRQTGGQTQFGGERYGNDGRGAPLPPPRRPAPYDQPEAARGGPYEQAEPARDDYFRESAPPPRRPAPYGQPDSSRGGERSGDYTRPPQRPRADPPARAW